jgi:hypothetical protein
MQPVYGMGGVRMKRTPGFNTRASTYSIGLAPTSRATCRVCKQVVGKGEVRIVTHAFVRPGRSHDFVCHARCATLKLVQAMVSVYGAVEWVPIAKSTNTAASEEVRTSLKRVLES